MILPGPARAVLWGFAESRPVASEGGMVPLFGIGLKHEAAFEPTPERVVEFILRFFAEINWLLFRLSLPRGFASESVGSNVKPCMVLLQIFLGP